MKNARHLLKAYLKPRLEFNAIRYRCFCVSSMNFNSSTDITLGQIKENEESVTKRSLWKQFNSTKPPTKDSITLILKGFESLHDYKAISKLLLKVKSLHLTLEPHLLVRYYRLLGNGKEIDKILGKKPRIGVEMVNELLKYHLENNRHRACINLLKYNAHDSETLVTLASRVPDSLDVVIPLIESNKSEIVEYCLANEIVLDIDLDCAEIAYLNGKLLQEPKAWVVKNHLKPYMNGFLDSKGDPIEMQLMIQKTIETKF